MNHNVGLIVNVIVNLIVTLSVEVDIQNISDEFELDFSGSSEPEL